MHDSPAKPHRCPRVSLILMSFGILLSFASQNAFAFYNNNVSCTTSGTQGLVELGTLAPSEKIEQTMTGSCKVLRRFQQAAGLSFTQQFGASSGKENFTALHTNSGDYVTGGGMGTTSTTCVPSSCVALNVGTMFSYEVKLSGKAQTNPGRYTVALHLYLTSVGWESYSDLISKILVTYTVTEPTCSLSSSKTMNLSFGTLNSNDFASQQQVANITMNCSIGTQVTATLVPTQDPISGSTGVSATTLAGLSMEATWADNNTAVSFNSPRSLTLNTGVNTIGVGFRPRLNPGAFPTGSFTSQYTLNINYL